MRYRNLTPWSYPDNYMGQTWYGWYAVYGQNRDSDALRRSNHRRILEDLRKLDTELQASAIDPRNDRDDSMGDSTVCDAREGHWACGWIEIIYVHSSNTAACERADEILGALEDYPVYDESDFSALEDEDCERVWANAYDERERVEYLRKHVHEVYPYPGETRYTMLRAAVKGSWSHAANMLPCPSELLY